MRGTRRLESAVDAEVPARMYEERFGFTPMLVGGLVAALLMTVALGVLAAGTDMLTDPLGRAVAAVVAGGAVMAAFILVRTLRRPVALRVDAAGVTLGRPPTPLTHDGRLFRTRPVTVPWRDIEGIVLFTREVLEAPPIDNIGLRLVRGAPVPPGDPDEPEEDDGVRSRRRSSSGGAPPPGNVVVWRQIYGWRLDRRRLGRSVRRYARGVRVGDAS